MRWKQVHDKLLIIIHENIETMREGERGREREKERKRRQDLSIL